MDEDQMIQAENAIISEYSEKDGYHIIPEEEGTVIEEKQFLQALEEAILNLQEHMVLAEKDCYVKPEYTQESEEVIKLAETMNRYAGAVITYEFGDSQEVLDGKTISQWISVNDEYKAKLSRKKIEEYVAGLAETYNTAGKSKSLASSYGASEIGRASCRERVSFAV